jgi:hypothetical protein
MSTNIRSQKIGDVYYQNGNGVPTHVAIIGTVYIDVDTGLFYTNRNGIVLWSEPGGGSGGSDISVEDESVLVTNSVTNLNFIGGIISGSSGNVSVEFQTPLGFTPEDVDNKVNDFTSPDTITYPSTQAVAEYVNEQNLVKFVDVTTSRALNSGDYDATLRIKADVTLTIPNTGLINNFICFTDVYDGFQLDWATAVGVTLSGNEGTTQLENTVSMLYRDGLTNEYRLRGEV